MEEGKYGKVTRKWTDEQTNRGILQAMDGRGIRLQVWDKL